MLDMSLVVQVGAVEAQALDQESRFISPFAKRFDELGSRNDKNSVMSG